jgi:FlaA1/EpsC-like NDP-sugar epimerase
MAAPRYIPRWMILVIDLGLCLLALLAAYQLRFNFHVPPHEYALLGPVLPVFVLVRLVSFWGMRIHRQQVKHTSTEDARRIFLTVLGGSAVIGVLGLLRFAFWDGLFLLPTSVLIIDFLGSAMLLIASRIAVKLYHLRNRGSGKDAVGVVLYGAGAAGLITKRTLERDGSARYRVAAFVDDDARKAGQRLEGVEIRPAAELPGLLKEGNIQQVIIAIQQPDPENRRRVVDHCMAAHVQVRSVPPVSDWINGQLSSGQLREVRIEDLLGRAPIALDDSLVRQRFQGRRVLVTGAAGSIGSELVRQLASLGAARTTLLDIAESPLYDLEMELQHKGCTAIHVAIADVRDRAALERVFAQQRPEIVFHAAAYKHVPLMEAHVDQAVRTNVQGTRHVADLCSSMGVEECVLISTDKAVNPTSVMGATKRVAEQYVQGLGEGGPTRFITTRFGNVLGSNGSVIPLFRRQIAEGGPVTVTDPEVTRFFMTIPEACRLVLEAATMGKGGEIYVFDMGQPVRIQDLAEKMIRLSGKEPGRDIAIVHTGLRPGEKRYEELLASQENTLPTHHPRILIGRTRPVAHQAVVDGVGELIAYAERGEHEACRRTLRKLVPEYAPPALDTFAHPSTQS